ncbi:MAG: hypothetical protein EXR72_17180 [Myxococcales bacterium]|nr:hypothetical protein [Myxococcales bacterium]
MAERAEKIARVCVGVAVRWDTGRARATLAGLLRRRRRRAIGRIATGLALAVAVLVGAALGRSDRPPLPALADRSLHFRDGSLATPLDEETEVRTAVDSPRGTTVELARGGARFAVAHNPARIFRVEADGAVIEVLGTRFIVERTPLGVRVEVEQGRVRASRDGRTVVLGDGESVLLAPPEPARDWRSLAGEGEFDRAWQELSAQSLSLRTPDDLLLAADVARLSHHPAEAVAPLERIVREHRGDPRAPLAAFTLGRVLLEQLGRPREAARAFEEAQALDPRGALVEDALAREVESWSRAGETGRAAERARSYAARYQRRLGAVRRFGGL